MHKRFLVASVLLAILAMNRVLAPLLVLAMLVGGASISHATTAVYFDVANAPDHSSSLPPVLVGGAASLVTATFLVPHNVGVSYDCCIDGPGDFIFNGWQVKELPLNYTKHIEFSVTALAPATFTNLMFTGFGGVWSNMGGPRSAFVQASRDGFVTDVTQYWSGGGWNMVQTSPYITDSPNDFVYDISGLGTLGVGQTMTFRFYFANTDYGHISGGFWNKSPNDYNPTVEFSAAPTPAIPGTWGRVKTLYR